MLILEYCSEPVRPGLFRKLSVFRVGDRMLGYTCVHDDTWLVKYGKAGLAPVELYEEEYSFVETNPFGPAMLDVFNIAGIDYGRVDFGLVGGRPQIYEINSNPMVEPKPPASLMDRRNQSVALFRNNYLEAMEAIDTGRRPAWMRSTGSLVRSTRELPRRARRLADGTYGKLKGAAARKSGDTAIHGRMKSGTSGALVLLLGAAVFLNYVDRGAIGIAAPLMKAELGLSDEAYGVAFSAFFWVYAPVQLFAGWLCDRFSVYRLMAAGILLWAGSTLLMGFAGGFASLLVLRIMLGVGESISFPGSSKIIARHVPPERRGVANAAVAAGHRAWPGGRNAGRRADPRPAGAGGRCSSSSGS